MKQVEDQLGRDREAPRFGPRSIDLDILTWNGKIVDDDVYDRYFLQDAINELDDSIRFDN